ncbi:MAG: PaaI family thioesterase [Nocardioides sp.]
MDDAPEPTATADVHDRITRSFESQGLMRLLGARLTHVGPGLVRIVLPSRPEVSQQHGYVHAGATSAIADTAGGYAALSLLGRDDEVLTVEYKINLLAPAEGDHLEAVGTVVKAGRTLTVCTLEVFGVRDDHRTLVAAGQQTIMRVAGSGRSTARSGPP